MKFKKLNALDYLQLIILGTAIVITIVFLMIGIIHIIELNSDTDISTSNSILIEPVNEDSPIEIISSNKNYYEISDEERYLLAKLAHAEASICSQECQEAVISVVFNRLESGKWNKDMNGDNNITIYDIIYYPNAFTPATTGDINNWEPTSRDYAAVDAILKNGPTVPTYVRYFRTSHDFNWEGYENYKIIDNVYFGYFSEWEKGAW